MRSYFLGVLTTLAVLSIGGLSYLRLGLVEVRADLPPSKWENYLMSMAVHASVRRRAPEVPNPVPPTDENLIAGGKSYLGGCAGCHGTPGKHDSWRNTPSLYPEAPQLPDVGTEYSEAQIFWIAKHGIRRAGMFANGAWTSDQELWTLAAYIKRIRSLPPGVLEALKPKKSDAEK